MKKLIIIAIIAAMLLMLTSCAGSERLKNMTIVQALALDVEDGIIVATLQYLDLNKGSANEGISGNITSHISGVGKTINASIKNAGCKLPDALFFGQNKIIVISDEFEMKYASQLREYLIKNKESRPDAFIMKSSGKAADVITNAQKNTIVPADSVYKQLKRLNKDVNVCEYLAGEKLRYY